MVTLVLLALEGEEESARLIEYNLENLPRWPDEPKAKETTTLSDPPPPPPPPPPGNDGDHGDNKKGDAPPRHGDASAKRRRESKADFLPWVPTPAERPCADYCTQACLLGLARKGPLDLARPNASLHVQAGQDDQFHAITRFRLCELIRRQLAENMDNGVQSLARFGLYGATGAMFKVTLLGYGYTVVAKGVSALDVSAIVHEARIYAHCESLQGVLIPVFLGNLELAHPYRVCGLVPTKHMMLLSWAGVSLERHEPEGVDVFDAIAEMKGVLRRHGIRNGDVREANLVWNEELGRVMAIDFDLARIEEQEVVEAVGHEMKKRTHLEVEPVEAEPPGKKRRELTGAA